MLAPALLQLTALQSLKYVCGCRAGGGGIVARAGRRVVRKDVVVHVCGGMQRQVGPWLVWAAVAACAARSVTCAVPTCGMPLCEDRLGGNRLGDAGAAALAPALRELTALRTLMYVRM